MVRVGVTVASGRALERDCLELCPQTVALWNEDARRGRVDCAPRDSGFAATSETLCLFFFARCHEMRSPLGQRVLCLVDVEHQISGPETMV